MDDFLRELDALRDEHIRLFPHLPMEYSPELQQRIVAYLRQQLQAGQTLAQCSAQLQLPASRLRRWMLLYPRPSLLAPPPGVPRPPQTVMPVQVCPELVSVPDGVPERRYTVRTPSGYEVPQLRIEELVYLLRCLL